MATVLARWPGRPLAVAAVRSHRWNSSGRLRTINDGAAGAQVSGWLRRVVAVVVGTHSLDEAERARSGERWAAHAGVGGCASQPFPSWCCRRWSGRGTAGLSRSAADEAIGCAVQLASGRGDCECLRKEGGQAAPAQRRNIYLGRMEHKKKGRFPSYLIRISRPAPPCACARPVVPP